MTETMKISKDLWNIKRKHGYASISNGQRYILRLEHSTGATLLMPVEVEGMKPAKGTKEIA